MTEIKPEENILALEGKWNKVKHHLANLVTYAIDYFTNIQKIRKKKDKDRKTELRIFDTIDATKVVLRNEKFYVNRAEGFIGTSQKR